MSIAGQFIARWDAILDAADESTGKDAVRRRSDCHQAIDGLDECIMPKSAYVSLMNTIEKMKAQLAEATARVEELEDALRFQDIETAKIDGTTVILHFQQRNGVHVIGLGHYARDMWWWKMSPTKPTHWTPLPKWPDKGK